jgi:hypothetical protein
LIPVAGFSKNERKNSVTIKKHLTLYLITFLAWLGFYLLGLPSNYYTDWSQAELILLSLFGVFALFPVVGALVLILMGGDYVRTSFWLAFYASVPLFFYDFIVVGIIDGEGLHFIVTHWYLSLAYLYVWLILPLVGLALQKFKNQPYTAS